VIHRDLRPANVFVTDKGLLKVGDFGTSRFLEIAAHGTTVIGSPPYMAPEQFEGRAVFASDLYSLGVTMYQMLTGELPYDTPAPADLDRLRRGELVKPPRHRNPQVPIAVDDIVMRALAGAIPDRYQRAEDLMEDILRVRREVLKRPVPSSPPASGGPDRPAGIDGPAGPDRRPDGPVRTARPRVTPSRVRTRDVAPGRFCWNCRKPLPARATRCPFCDETQ
jgi:serine/threonine protein kinase